jgi:M6 family metalloprotease-like protein
VRRGKTEFEKSIELVADDSTSSLAPEEQRTRTPWKKDVYRLAVICVEFPDAKHNAEVKTPDWSDSFFSHHSYTNKNVTGQKAYGSMADYYEEISCGKLRVEGKVFDWVEVKGKRSEFNTGRTGSSRSNLFASAIAAVLKRDGASALKDFDGIGLIYAGARYPNANRGSILWPHRASITIRGKSWPYVIVAEGGERMATISTMCHETGHILGLPDLYARPENPGSEGAGTWCAMSNQSPNGRPQHFSAWSKEQLGWLTPVVIDPTVKQKLVLAPIENSPNECFKVLVRPDGSEYFLLENRRKIGFDASLAAEGLLIWRVVANRPMLEEAHGVDGPNGPRVFLTSVPYPSKANHSFTPYTTPSSRSQLGGGAPVFITNIQKLADGRITFDIGHEFQ